MSLRFAIYIVPKGLSSGIKKMANSTCIVITVMLEFQNSAFEPLHASRDEILFGAVPANLLISLLSFDLQIVLSPLFRPTDSLNFYFPIYNSADTQSNESPFLLPKMLRNSCRPALS